VHLGAQRRLLTASAAEARRHAGRACRAVVVLATTAFAEGTMRGRLLLLLLPLSALLAACAAHGPRPEDARWFRPPYEDCMSLDCGDYGY
jgi:hypothetical protein